MAKRFFYVCAGIFMLALSYHLGAVNARAQSDAIQVGNIGYFYGNTHAAAVGRTLYRVMGSTSTASPAEPIPGTPPIIAVNSVDPAAMLTNGDVYGWDGTNRTWALRANMLGEPTSAQHETWGSVKVGYHN